VSREHWSQQYVGRIYIEGEFDCADLARVVHREQFGREIRLPAHRWHAGLAGAGRLRAMTAQIEALKDDYAVRTLQPREGDGVLLIGRGHLDHIGIYCVIEGVPWVLHAASNARQVVLHRVRDLPAQGLTVEGFYRWI
jgi:hypothetical protein